MHIYLIHKHADTKSRIKLEIRMKAKVKTSTKRYKDAN